MPRIGSDLMKQWERQYTYLWRVQQEHGTLTYDQQKQWDFLAPIFEVGGNSGEAQGNSDDRTSGVR